MRKSVRKTFESAKTLARLVVGLALGLLFIAFAVFWLRYSFPWQPGLVDYRQNIVVRDGQTSPGFALCDAVAELWFESGAALDSVWDTPAGLAAIADNARFLDLDRTHYAVVAEHPPR